MRRAAIGCVLLALVAAPAICAVARRASVGRAVAIYVDGAKTGPTDPTTGGPTDGFMVGDVPMISLRSFDADLHDDVDEYLRLWGLEQIRSDVTAIAFKVGGTTASGPGPAPMIGGRPMWVLRLPVAPRYVGYHVYVPALPILKRLGHATEWDPRTRTLRTTKKATEDVMMSP